MYESKCVNLWVIEVQVGGFCFLLIKPGKVFPPVFIIFDILNYLAAGCSLTIYVMDR